METTTIKQSLIKVKDDVLIFINNECYLKFTKVFQFPGSPNAFIGHINIWDDNAPFYILYDRKSLKKLSIKGYNKCLFIPNSFIIGFDKNNKMYLRCVIDNPDTYLKYYPVTSIADLRKLVTLKSKGSKFYSGFSKSKSNGVAIHGECFEIISNIK
jgi:hypothetical protein